MTAEHAAKEVSRCHTGAGVLGIGRAAMSYSHPTELWPTRPPKTFRGLPSMQAREKTMKETQRRRSNVQIS